jgi:hypothetical protein
MRRGYARTLFLEQHGGDHSKPHQTKQHSFHGALPAPISSKSLKGRTPRSRGRQHGSDDVSSEDMYRSMYSGSRSSSCAASRSPTPAPRAFANPYYYSPPVVTVGSDLGNYRS